MAIPIMILRHGIVMSKFIGSAVERGIETMPI